MYRLHLSATYGYYNHLILRMQIEYNINRDLEGFLDFPLLNTDRATTSKSKNRQPTLPQLTSLTCALKTRSTTTYITSRTKCSNCYTSFCSA